jgi:CHAT domain-containing protein
MARTIHLAAALILAGVVRAQTAEGSLAAGREVVARLSLNQQTDAALFAAFGMDRAQQALMAVQSSALGNESPDRPLLHRATSGLVELAVARQNYVLASTWAGLQSQYYRFFDDDYGKALEADRLALDLRRKSGSAANLDIAFDQIGRDLIALSRPDDALDAIDKALDLDAGAFTQVAGWLHRDRIHALVAAGKLDTAREEMERLVNASTTASPVYRASILLASADVALADADPSLAVKRIREAVDAGAAIAEANAPLMSASLVAMRSGTLEEARAFADRIDRLFPELPARIAPFAELNIAMRKRLAGDLTTVLREQIASLDEARAVHNIPAQVLGLRMLAATYHAANSTANESALLQDAWHLQRGQFTREGAPPDVGAAVIALRILNSLADAEHRSSDTSRARADAQQARHLFESFADPEWRNKAKSEYGTALLLEARIEASDDDVDEARAILDRALNDQPATAKFDRAEVLWQRARLERGDAHPQDAIRFYRDAIAALRTQQEPENEAQCRIEFVHTLLTSTPLDAAAAAEADTQLKQAEAVVGPLNVSEVRWRIPYERGILAESQRDSAAALSEYREAFRRLDQVRNLAPAQQRQSLLDRELIQDLYRRLLDSTARENNIASVWDVLEKTRSRTFLDTLQGRTFQSRRSDPAASEIARLENRIAALQVEAQPGNVAVLRSIGRTPQAGRAELERSYAELEMARQQASLTSSRAGSVLAANPTSLTQIQSRLSPDAALLEFGITRVGLIRLVLTRGHADYQFCKLDTVQLRRDTSELEGLFSSPGNLTRFNELLKQVSGQVFGSALESLPRSITRLLIVPSGFLNYLPFPALQTGSGEVLLERFTVSYLPSASVLSFLPARFEPSKDVFVGAIGNVSVEGKTPLPGTLREAEAVSALYPSPKEMLGSAFTHEAAVQALTQHAIVHFASHGVFEPQSPMFSAILTANSPGQPSRVSVFELPDIEFAARLVVLSACETGKGRVSNGDEITGLTRSMLVAGADTVVSSLWQVSDASTAELMVSFHRHLLQGARPSAALRSAALEVRTKYPDPFYWAPFVVTGAN